MQGTYRTLLRVIRLDFVVKTELNTRSPISLPLLYAKPMGNRKPLTAKKVSSLQQIDPVAFSNTSAAAPAHPAMSTQQKVPIVRQRPSALMRFAPQPAEGGVQPLQ